MGDKPDYRQAVASAAAQGLLTGVWTAAGELSPGWRRLARATASLAVMGVGWSSDTSGSRNRVVTWNAEDRLVITEDGERKPAPKPAVMVAGVVFGVGMIVGRRQWEKRWLARLERDGHAHPYRALALRVGLLSAAGTLASRLIEARAKRES